MEEEVNIYWDKRTLRPNYVSCQAICTICIRLLSFRWRQVGGIDFHLNLTFFLRKLTLKAMLCTSTDTSLKSVIHTLPSVLQEVWRILTIWQFFEIYSYLQKYYTNATRSLKRYPKSLQKENSICKSENNCSTL